MKSLKNVKFALCGPSGCGKTTLINKFLEKYNNFELSISYTTRNKREGELDNEYVFITKEEFLNLKDQDFFLETEEIFGNYYGTKKIKTNHNTIFNIGLKGKQNLETTYPEIISIFVFPPSFEDLKFRLENRSSHCLERAETFFEQMENSKDFKFFIINDDIENALIQLENIIKHVNFQNLAKNKLKEFQNMSNENLL